MVCKNNAVSAMTMMHLHQEQNPAKLDETTCVTCTVDGQTKPPPSQKKQHRPLRRPNLPLTVP